MQQYSSSIKKVYEIMAALIVWFALILQLWLIIEKIPENGFNYASEIIRYFSYMTILSNIMVALCFSFQLVFVHTKWGRFFSRSSVQAAIFVYIFIVGVLNHLLLSHLSNLTGLQLLCDRLLHYLMPVVYVLWWIAFTRKKELAYGSIFPWLIFPLLYVIYSMIRGAYIHQYPYPFLNAEELGYAAVFKMMGLITGAYAVTAVAQVFVNNMIVRNNTHL